MNADRPADMPAPASPRSAVVVDAPQRFLPAGRWHLSEETIRPPEPNDGTEAIGVFSDGGYTMLVSQGGTWTQHGWFGTDIASAHLHRIGPADGPDGPRGQRNDFVCNQALPITRDDYDGIRLGNLVWIPSTWHTIRTYRCVEDRYLPLADVAIPVGPDADVQQVLPGLIQSWLTEQRKAVPHLDLATVGLEPSDQTDPQAWHAAGLAMTILQGWNEPQTT